MTALGAVASQDVPETAHEGMGRGWGKAAETLYLGMAGQLRPAPRPLAKDGDIRGIWPIWSNG